MKQILTHTSSFAPVSEKTTEPMTMNETLAEGHTAKDLESEGALADL
jgi:hypothetical protein